MQTMKSLKMILLLFLCLPLTHAVMYEMEDQSKMVSYSEIVFQEELPSKLTCAHHCALYKAEMIFNRGLCKCVKTVSKGYGKTIHKEMKIEDGDRYYKIKYAASDPPPPPPDCEKNNVEYLDGPTTPMKIPNINSWSECRGKCSIESSCLYWTYYLDVTEILPSYRKRCDLFPDISGSRQKTGITQIKSGRRDCINKECVPVYKPYATKDHNICGFQYVGEGYPAKRPGSFDRSNIDFAQCAIMCINKRAQDGKEWDQFYWFHKHENGLCRCIKNGEGWTKTHTVSFYRFNYTIKPFES